MIPTRRSSAEAVQILLSHALGDAGSPYLVGLVCVLEVVSFIKGHTVLYGRYFNPLTLTVAIWVQL